MNAAPSGETIFALASGSPPSAIAIVRLSGPAAAFALRQLAGDLPPPRHAMVRALRDPAGTLLDRAMVLWFPGSASATGEDLVELQLHGGRAVVAAVQATLAAVSGCRPALPGEFTRRAFVHGRIDLLQAQALADLLAAETEGARRLALRAAEGGLSRLVEGWRERLLLLGARAEAVLEFGADDPDIAADPGLVPTIAALAAELEAAAAAPPAERLRDGVRVVIAGPANAGKSTLMNALAGRDVALATPIAGTTRDLVEAPVVIAGIAMVLVDSAGLRASEDPVERLGIARAAQAMAAADLILWLGSPAERPVAGPTTLIVHPRCDLPSRQQLPAGADLAVSAETGVGMIELRDRLVALAGEMLPSPAQGWGQAQQAQIAMAASALRRAGASGEEILVAEEIVAATVALDHLTGRRNVEEVLDRLFGRFCVGK